MSAAACRDNSELHEALLTSLTPSIQREVEYEVARRVGAQLVTMRAYRSNIDRDLLAACNVVADAVDALDSALFTPGEIAARRHVGRAAARLRNQMRKKGNGP